MYVLLALSAGIAGSLSITKGVAQALVGVMVAVALLPPIVTAGLLLIGSMYLRDAVSAFLLFSINVVCINLAGVITFITQGISPKTWWEKKKARKMVWKAILIWFLLLLSLALMIMFYPEIK